MMMIMTSMTKERQGVMRVPSLAVDQAHQLSKMIRIVRAIQVTMAVMPLVSLPYLVFGRSNGVVGSDRERKGLA